MVSIILEFEASQGSCGLLFDLLYTIADLYPLENVGLVKSQDVGVGFDFSRPFLIVILFMFVTPCFSELPTSLLLPTPTPYS